VLDLARLGDAVRHEGGVSRRLLLAYGAALAGLPLLARRAAVSGRQPSFPTNPFALGVASGDPLSTSVVIWTRVAPRPTADGGGMRPENVDVRWEVADDERMSRNLMQGRVAAAHGLGHAVHVEVPGLQPDRWYFYRFHCGDATSPVGRTRTVPDTNATPDRLRFAMASCQHFEQGLFTAYEHMARDDLDLVFFLGDYIYEGAGQDGRVRKHGGPPNGKLTTLGDYRGRYAQYRSDPLLKAMHARCPWVVTWDDHEVENNYAGRGQDSGVVPKKALSAARFLEKRAAAYQAYYEAMPLGSRCLPQGPDLRLYRLVKFGKLASFPVLDTRQYRTPQPNGGEPSPLNKEAQSPTNTMLGERQKEWLKALLAVSNATWNVPTQQVMMGMVDTDPGKLRRYSMDKWTGAVSERREILEWVAGRKVSNVVVLSGDIHSNWVADLHLDDRQPNTPVVATEFVGTSVSSKGNGPPVPPALADVLASNPTVKFHDDQRGYVRCTVTPREWRTEFRVLDDVTRPGGKVSTAATFAVAAGRAGAGRV